MIRLARLKRMYLSISWIISSAERWVPCRRMPRSAAICCRAGRKAAVGLWNNASAAAKTMA